jgi:hypothetical protein
MDGVGDDYALRRPSPAVTDLPDLRVDEQVRVAALVRALAERLHLLIEQEQIRDTSDFDTRSPHASTSWSTRLSRPRTHRPAAPPTRAPAASACPAAGSSGSNCLGGAWESAARSRRGVCPSGESDSGCGASSGHRGGARPSSAPTSSATSTSIQLAREQTQRLTQHVGVLVEQALPDDLLNRHPLGTGHQWCLLRVEPSASPTMVGAAVAETTWFRPPRSALLHHAVGRDQIGMVEARSLRCLATLQGKFRQLSTLSGTGASRGSQARL